MSKSTACTAGLSPIPETMLIALRCRAAATLQPQPLIRDEYALDLLRKLDEPIPPQVMVGSRVGVANRTMFFDRQAMDFVRRHPNGVVVNLGCGLDARRLRLGLQEYSWFDLDVPEAVALRKKLLPEASSQLYLEASAFDGTWYDRIPQNRPVLFIAEGLLMYFTENEVKRLLLDLFARFPQGECLWEIMSTWMARNVSLHPDVRKSRAVFKWGIDDCKEIDRWAGRPVLRNEWWFMNLYKSYQPWYLRLFFCFLPTNRIIQLRFNQTEKE
jgi:O-methyltransferase involved in polyketide biosynthesis